MNFEGAILASDIRHSRYLLNEARKRAEKFLQDQADDMGWGSLLFGTVLGAAFGPIGQELGKYAGRELMRGDDYDFDPTLFKLSRNYARDLDDSIEDYYDKLDDASKIDLFNSVWNAYTKAGGFSPETGFVAPWEVDWTTWGMEEGFSKADAKSSWGFDFNPNAFETWSDFKTLMGDIEGAKGVSFFGFGDDISFWDYATSGQDYEEALGYGMFPDVKVTGSGLSDDLPK